MKKSRPLYLLSLFFLVLQGYHFALAKFPARDTGQPSAETIRLDKLQKNNNSQQKEFAYNYSLFSERDDDDENPSVRKKTFASRFPETVAGIALLAVHPEPSCSLQSNNNSSYLPHDKYIFQRTLRV